VDLSTDTYDKWWINPPYAFKYYKDLQGGAVFRGKGENAILWY
jgi:hypothetical protein